MRIRQQPTVSINVNVVAPPESYVNQSFDPNGPFATGVLTQQQPTATTSAAPVGLTPQSLLASEAAHLSLTVGPPPPSSQTAAVAAATAQQQQQQRQQAAAAPTESSASRSLRPLSSTAAPLPLQQPPAAVPQPPQPPLSMPTPLPPLPSAAPALAPRTPMPPAVPASAPAPTTTTAATTTAAAPREMLSDVSMPLPLSHEQQQQPQHYQQLPQQQSSRHSPPARHEARGTSASTQTACVETETTMLAERDTSEVNVRGSSGGPAYLPHQHQQHRPHHAHPRGYPADGRGLTPGGSETGSMMEERMSRLENKLEALVPLMHQQLHHQLQSQQQQQQQQQPHQLQQTPLHGHRDPYTPLQQHAASPARSSPDSSRPPNQSPLYAHQRQPVHLPAYSQTLYHDPPPFLPVHRGEVF